MKDFKKLKVWQKGMEIVRECYELASILPNHEKFGLSGQISRAAVSIPSNISEGSSRGSDKAYNRFLEFALGSCFEIETQVLVSQMIYPETQFDFDNLLIEIDEEQKMILSFMKTLAQSR